MRAARPEGRVEADQRCDRRLEAGVVFNLLEEFHGETTYDQNVVSYLELLRLPYTGCNPRGLMLARGKDAVEKARRLSPHADAGLHGHSDRPQDHTARRGSPSR